MIVVKITIKINSAGDDEPLQVQVEKPSQVQVEEPSQVKAEEPSQVQVEERSQVQVEEPSQVQVEKWKWYAMPYNGGVGNVLFDPKVLSGPYNSKDEVVAVCSELNTKNPEGYPHQARFGDFIRVMEDGRIAYT